MRDRAFDVTRADGECLTATFAQLCSGALAPIEYRRWSRAYRHWVLTDVPPLTDVAPSAQQRFVNLIDVLVDADVRLDVYATVDLPTFLAGAGTRPDGFRMGSRLRLLRTS